MVNQVLSKVLESTYHSAIENFSSTVRSDIVSSFCTSKHAFKIFFFRKRNLFFPSTSIGSGRHFFLMLLMVEAVVSAVLVLGRINDHLPALQRPLIAQLNSSVAALNQSLHLPAVDDDAVVLFDASLGLVDGFGVDSSAGIVDQDHAESLFKGMKSRSSCFRLNNLFSKKIFGYF